MSAADAARHIGCNRSTVTRAAHRLGVGTPVGTILLLSDSEFRRISKIVRDGPGNPNVKPGYGLGRTNKKSAKKTKKP
jgi:hypothetical protein